MMEARQARPGKRPERYVPPDVSWKEADMPAVSRAMEEAPRIPWWQRAGEWVQDKVNKFVTHPPSWLSLSWSSPEFSLSNYTLAHISYQPLAQNFLQTITYQQVQTTVKAKGTLTANPRGLVDIDFSDGTITFTGKKRSVFVQPFALSFGWKSVLNSQVVDDATVDFVNMITVDFDLLGTNWCSLKISHAQGIENKTTFEIDGTEFERTSEASLDVTMQVHRWPRIVAGIAAAYVAFEVGALEAVTTAGPVLLERLLSSVQQVPALVEQLPGWIKQIPVLQQGVAP